MTLFDSEDDRVKILLNVAKYLTKIHTVTYEHIGNFKGLNPGFISDCTRHLT
jgi:hypothetical protein